MEFVCSYDPVNRLFFFPRSRQPNTNEFHDLDDNDNGTEGNEETGRREMGCKRGNKGQATRRKAMKREANGKILCLFNKRKESAWGIQMELGKGKEGNAFSKR